MGPSLRQRSSGGTVTGSTATGGAGGNGITGGNGGVGGDGGLTADTGGTITDSHYHRRRRR